MLPTGRWRQRRRRLAPSDSLTHTLFFFATGMCINIVEVSWKAKLKQAFPDPNSYSAFMGNFSSMTGTVTLIMMLLGRTIFQKFGWRTAALVTPAVSTAITQRTVYYPVIQPLEKQNLVLSNGPGQLTDASC